MKKRFFLFIVCCSILFTGLSLYASEQNAGTWKLIHVWGVLLAPDWYVNNCELITIKNDSADYYVNGKKTFSGSIDSLISKNYQQCTLSVVGDTLRFKRTRECCDIPFSWEWVRYTDSLRSFDGTWRWIETVGGFTGVSRTRSDYFEILKVNGIYMTNSIDDSIVFSGTRDSLLGAYGTQFSWTVVADTLIASQRQRCCDIPYLFKWIRWASGLTGVHVSNRNKAVSVKEKPMFFDIRGRKIISGRQTANGIHLLYNKGTAGIIIDVHTNKTQIVNK